jgi:hypothetical protein
MMKSVIRNAVFWDVFFIATAGKTINFSQRMNRLGSVAET